MELKPWQEELYSIVYFLNNSPREESEKLWSVLTALREPDSDNVETKGATTAVLRNKIGLRYGVGGAIVCPDQPMYAMYRKEHYPFVSNAFGTTMLWDHFYSHAHSAFQTLGLKWEEYNEKFISFTK